MKENNEIVLSILIISHNQRDLLIRCVESVLKQDLPYSHEIIISDDGSTDGTWEQIMAYASKYPELIKGYQCNSSQFQPNCSSERCGVNKLNAYQHSSGKYFVNLDADDYLICEDVYKKSVELLEEHPECSMCQHRVLHVNDGEDLEKGFSYFQDIPTGTIYKAAYLIANNNMLDVNPGFVIRRNRSVNMELKLGKYFNDRSITYLHLLYGDCIWLNSFGYVYVAYRNAISQYTHYQLDELSLKNNVDILARIQLIPEWAGVFMKYCGIRAVANIYKYRNSNICLLNNSKMTFRDFEGFTFKYFLKTKRTMFEHIWAWSLRIIFYLIKRVGIAGGPYFYKCLYAMATSYKVANIIPLDYWKENRIK